MKDTGMELQKTTSKTSLLNLMVLKAWHERWSDSQWGINIKTVLPRGVSGDVYNLADCILQQAVIGSSANPLVLSYLKHSLCAHLVSHAAVLKRISKYENFNKVYCVTSLLEFLQSVISGVTCRSKPEEAILPGAVVSLVYWLMQIFASCTEQYAIGGKLSPEHQILIDNTTEVIETIINNDFLMGILYIGKQEDPDFFGKIREKYSDIKSSLISSGYKPNNVNIEKELHRLAYIDIGQLHILRLESEKIEPISYCVQPLLAVEVLLNPSSETQFYVSELLMIQRLKNYSMVRLFYEIIRAGFISLSNVIETSHDTMWGAFTFFKVPLIIKQLNALSHHKTNEIDHIPEVVEALDLLLEDTLILDFMDTKCSCNMIEYLLNDWKKQQLVNDVHIKRFSVMREPTSLLLQKREVANQAPSIINFIIRAEVPLSGVLKTLSADYNKVQEALLGVLCQVLVGNSFDLILSVATVEGRLRTFVSRLIQCNEQSKQVPGEVGKTSVTRSTLFDVSFLMLTFIVQKYGSEVVLSENGDSFFEKWVRECMVERNKPKSPRNMVALCDENIVDELLLSLSKPEAQLKNSNLTWQDICMNIPGVLYQVLVAWENETLSSTDVKGILDSIKCRLFSFSVCAASFLCAYMQTVREDEFLKPLNMVQQFLSTLSPEEMSSQDNTKERLGLSFQIIRKMQHDIHPSGNPKMRSLTVTQNLVSHTPLIEQFKEVWKSVAQHGWVPVKAAQVLESLLQAGGPVWFISQLVKEVLKCKFNKDMVKTMDIVFAVMHLDIERNTLAMLERIVPLILFNKRANEEITESQSYILARLCVYCIISNLETRSTPMKKRSRSEDIDESSLGNAAKLRKLTNPESSDNSSSSDFAMETHQSSKEPPSIIKEPLQSTIQGIFKLFAQFVTTDELSPRVYFIFQFISLLVECGKDRVKPVLKLLPNNLIQNLLKVMVTDEITVGLICRIYDLRINTGRQSAVSDLCLWRNINLRKLSIQL